MMRNCAVVTSTRRSPLPLRKRYNSIGGSQFAAGAGDRRLYGRNGVGGAMYYA